MNRLTATADITDHNDEVIVPAGSHLTLEDGVYEGRIALTGFKIQMDTSWAEDEVYMEFFSKEASE